jgi:soluble lytic murein transglycosylase
MSHLPNDRARCLRVAHLLLMVCALLLQPAPAVAQDPAATTVPRQQRRGEAPTLHPDMLQPATRDAALMEALVALGQEQPALALEEIPRALADHATGEPLRSWLSFALGYARWLEGQWQPALDAFAGCGDDDHLFVDYCLYWSAVAQQNRQRPGEALALTEAVSPDAVYGPRARLLGGQLMLAMGRPADAVARLETLLAQHPRAFWRTDAELLLAEALVAAGDAFEAARLYHRLALVNPGSSVESTARRALEPLLAGLTAAQRAHFESRPQADLVDRAQVLFDRHRSEQVVEMLQPVLSDRAAPDRVRCEAAYLVGRSLTKLRRHGDAVEPYALADRLCRTADEDLHIRTLYNLGRSLWNADRDDEAHDTYNRLWQDYPRSTYADDAVLYAARVRRSQGRDQEAQHLLNLQMERWPDGDMLGEAVWLQMERLYAAGAWAEALAFADGIGSRTGETDRYSRGRVAYFRARCLQELGRRTDAADAFEQVVRAHPMGWYALLGLLRLRDLDLDRARALVRALKEAGEGQGEAILLRPPQLRQDPYFRRGMTFLQLGLYPLAQGEFGKLGERYPNEPDIDWVLAWLFDQAGAYHISASMPGQSQDLALSWPAGENLARWRISYPQPFGPAVRRWSQRRNLDPLMVWAIMRQESGFRADVESWANARGLMQLMLGTANDMARRAGRRQVTARQLFEADTNIELGTMFVRVLMDSFQGHPALVIGGYNGGQGNIRSWLRARGEVPLDLWVEQIPFAQTQNYVKGVTRAWWIYTWLYGEGDGWVELPWNLQGI